MLKMIQIFALTMLLVFFTLWDITAFFQTAEKDVITYLLLVLNAFAVFFWIKYCAKILKNTK